MGFIDWSDKYTVRNKELDEHHQCLFGIVNDLHKAIIDKRGKDEIRHIVDRLIEYTKSHFAAEERLMEACGYPHYQHHKAEHERLLRQVSELDRELCKSGDVAACDVFAFLIKDWLIGHILKDDKGYAPFLAKRHPAPRTETIPPKHRQTHTS